MTFQLFNNEADDDTEGDDDEDEDAEEDGDIINHTVGSGSFISPQLRTVGKKKVTHWFRIGRKIEVELDVKLRSNWT